MNQTQLRAEFTKKLIDVYQERIAVPSFLRSFFPTVTSPTKDISIEVERLGELVAVDVLRGTEGNRNTFSKSSEKVFTPPYYREYFDATELDIYDRVLGAMGTDNAQLFASLMNTVMDRLDTLKAKMERAKEIQCAQVLETGIVTVAKGTDIDFGRKTTSKVTLTGAFWDGASTDPFKQLETGCNFVRSVGKSGDAVFNALLGSDALSALLNNKQFLARQNLFNMALDQVVLPVRNATGGTYHGTVTAGGYKVQLWGYPQTYDAANGTATPYLNTKNVTIIPSMPRFKMAHAAVPQLVGEPGQLPVQGEYIVGEYLDTRKAVHDFDIQTAAIAVPVAVDQIYTAQVLS